jgi:hypothetical protein
MGTWITHLRIAENLLKHIPELDAAAFAFGNLSPDSGIPNADWTAFDPPKEVTHFLHRGDEEESVHDLVYYQQYLASIKPKDDIQLYSFRLGYFFHLICDILWAKRIVAATRQQFSDLFAQDMKRAVSLVKDDWYGLDQLYVLDHPRHIFWRVIMTQAYPPSYLPFIKDEALHHQYDYIRRFYSEQDDHWYLNIPYHYLKEETMTRFVEECIQGILIVHEQLKDINNFDGLVSSAGLLPGEMIRPYEMPLGN